MRFPARAALSFLAVATLLASSAARADDEPTVASEPEPAPPVETASTPAPPAAPLPPEPAEAPVTRVARRSEGLRLGLELGFQRAVDGNPDRMSAGSPSVIPLGVDVSFRTSESLLLGVHGSVGLASRDDCLSADSCRARAYTFGGHLETALGKGHTFVPWLRYGLNYELLYQGGLVNDRAGHVYRNGIDFVDLRVGGDFIVSRGDAGRTMRIGPYVGMIAGVLVGQTGVNYRFGRPNELDRDSGSAHVWMTFGVRGTLDP